MKANVVLRTGKLNLGRSNRCNNNNSRTTQGHTKTTATRLPNRTMGKVATKSRFKCQFHRTTLLQTQTTTVDSNSSSNSGSLVMGWLHNIKTLKWVTTCKMSTSSQTTSCKTTKLSHLPAESCLTKRMPRVKLSVREWSTFYLRQVVFPTLQFLPVYRKRRLTVIRVRQEKRSKF